MVFPWSLSDSKFPQVSRTLLSILTNLNNAVVWMVSTCPLISKSSSSCINPLVTVPRTPITIGIIITFMLRSFQFPSKVQVLLFTFFLFYSVISQDNKVHNSASSLFFVDYNKIPWCNGYRHRNWTWRHEFKSWTRLIPLGKVWIQLFSLQLWVNSRTD